MGKKCKRTTWRHYTPSFSVLQVYEGTMHYFGHNYFMRYSMSSLLPQLSGVCNIKQLGERVWDQG